LILFISGHHDFGSVINEKVLICKYLEYLMAQRLILLENGRYIKISSEI
jgi:hypothetical protein